MSGLFLAAAFQAGLLIAAWVLARNSTLQAPRVTGSTVKLGTVAVFTVGTAPAMGPIPNVAFVLGGALLIGFGMNAFQRPTSMTVEDVVATDAFGHQQYANSRPTTVAQGITAGVVCLLAGSVMLVLGVFFGGIAP